MNQNNQTILLVEDNEDDVFLFRFALESGRITNPVQVVMDGQEAVDYLAGAGKFADRANFPEPFIVFLDLKLPYADGFEILEWIGGQTGLRSTAVVILTGSSEARDQEKARALGARAYLVKPPTGEAINGQLKAVVDDSRRMV
jgi:CheY-like chemotaxis protein